MKKLIALLIAVLAISATTIPAMAATSKLTPGETKYKTYNISASPSYTVSLGSDTSTGMKCRVILSLNDLYNPNANGKPNWKKSAEMTLTKDSTHYTGTIRPSSTFNFVQGRSDMARLTFTALRTNSSTISVIYSN